MDLINYFLDLKGNKAIRMKEGTDKPKGTKSKKHMVKVYTWLSIVFLLSALTGSDLYATAPTIQASGLNFTGIGVTGLTLNWTVGNGSRRVVLIHEGSAVNMDPSNGTSYTVSADWNSGSTTASQIGTGNYIVYDGTGTSVNMTNLLSNHVYYFAVYEYNGSGLSTSEYLTPGATANQTTLATEPTTQATNIYYTAYTASSITLNFTIGNGSSRLVVARQGASITSDPADSVVYTVNNAFGSGTQIGTGNYVVGSGSGPITVTSLSAGLQYTFKVYEYNGSAGAINYLTSGGNGNPSSKTTLAAEPSTQATNVVFTGSTTSTLTANYTNGSGTSRLVVVHAGAPVDSDPVDSVSYTASTTFGSGDQIGTGNYVVKAGAGPVTVTGLSSNTVYYFRVYEFSGSGNTTNYNINTAAGNPAPKYTLATEPTTQATNILYTAYSASSITLNFTNGDGSSRLVVAKQGASITSDPVDSVVYTANNAFGSGTQIGAGNYVVGSGSGPITVTNLNAATQYTFKIYEYNGSGGAINYLTSAGNGNPSSKTTLSAEPTTQVTNVVFTGSTTSTITSNYTNGNGTSRLVVVHAGAPVDSNPVDSVSYTANAAFGTGDQIGTGNYVVKAGAGPVTVTGLSSNTVYYFRVYEFSGLRIRRIIMSMPRQATRRLNTH